MKLVDERADILTVVEACESVELPRASYYRSKLALALHIIIGFLFDV